MPSSSIWRARRAVVFLITPLLLVLLAGGLAACGEGAPAPARPAPAREDPFVTRAAPGEIALLQPTGATLGAPVKAYAWRQVAGPTVDLEDAGSPQAHFVMPALEEGATLEFTLTVERASGEVLAEGRTVRCERGSRGEHHPPPASPPQFAVFLANKDLATRIDLYLARLDGSEVFRLNGPVVPGGSLYTYRISPDRRYVAYIASEDAPGVYELFVARTDGGARTKVSGPLVAGGGVGDYAWSPDGTRIAYWTYGMAWELFTVRPDGTGNARASGPLVAGGYVFVGAQVWSPDGSRIAYVAIQYTSGVAELFTSRPDGTENVRVSEPVVAGGAVLRFAWSPDGSRIAYVGDVRTNEVYELFTVRPDGTDPVAVSTGLTAGGYVSAWDFAWSPDGSRIAYRADARVDDMWELFTVRPDGSGGTLASAVPYGSDVWSFAWSPDGTRILYLADQVTPNIYELFTSGPEGEANVRVSEPIPTGGFLGAWDWSPHGGLIAYGLYEAGYQHLHTVRGDGSDQVQVTGPFVAGGSTAGWRWSPDGAWLAYTADALADDVFELFTTAPGGGRSTRVSGTPVSGGDAYYFDWSADGSRLVYVADQLVDGRFELFVAAPDGGAVNAAISGPLTAGGRVSSFATR